MPTPPAVLPWHQALAYAVTGARIEALGLQDRPEVSRLAAELQQRQATGEVQLLGVPVAPVPDDLMAGLGAAQYRAALAGLRRALGAEPVARTAVSGRTLTAEERRLDADRPPHHGT